MASAKAVGSGTVKQSNVKHNSQKTGKSNNIKKQNQNRSVGGRGH